MSKRHHADSENLLALLESVAWRRLPILIQDFVDMSKDLDVHASLEDNKNAMSLQELFAMGNIWIDLTVVLEELNANPLMELVGLGLGRLHAHLEPQSVTFTKGFRVLELMNWALPEHFGIDGIEAYVAFRRSDAFQRIMTAEGPLNEILRGLPHMDIASTHMTEKILQDLQKVYELRKDVLAAERALLESGVGIPVNVLDFKRLREVRQL